MERSFEKSWTVEEVNDIADIIQKVYKIDFSEYALPSLSRRLKHTLKFFGLSDLKELKAKIINDASFQKDFVSEITVSATEMFRDPELWISLKREILPQIMRKGNPINIWIAGCSTGEEVYTLLILLKEADLLEQVKILATDLDSVSLETAEKGYYFNHTYEKNKSNYKEFEGETTLNSYFERFDLGYQMDRELLKNVVFKKSNLIDSETEGVFDIIFCRNVMIYFNQNLQSKILRKMIGRMKVDSYLILGAKESIMWLDKSNQFKQIKRLEKIYQLT